MRQMKLEPILQSKVNQKEKDKYHILTHIYGIQKNGTEELIYRETVEKQTQRIDLQTWGGGGGGKMYGKSNMETYITICKIDSQWEFAVWLKKLKPSKAKLLGATYKPSGGGMERQMGWSLCRWEGIYVYLWLIHFKV